MQLIPKKPLTWIVIAILAYGYFEYHQDNPPEPEKDSYVPQSKIDVAPKSKEPGFSDGPVNFFMNKLSETESGKVMVDALMKKSLEDKYGDKSISVITAQNTGEIVTLDTMNGDGDIAICGSSATINYKLFTERNIEFYSSGTQVKSTIGDGKFIKGLENGIIGMKKGGKRKIAVPSALAYDDPEFNNDVVAKGAPVMVEVELVDVRNGLNPDISMVTDILSKGEGDDKALCGNKVSISSENGEFDFVIGKGDVPLGIEMGVLNMKLGEIRRLSMPQEFLKIRRENKLPDNLQIPKQGRMVIEVELIGIGD
jgi:FKBP-type peptidyl-prolyl cis-trans isomerase